MPSDLFPPRFSTLAYRPSPGGVDPIRDGVLVREAHGNAIRVLAHRAEAIALADEIIRTLYEQHGGKHPFDLLYNWDRWDLRGLLSHQDSLAMVRVCRRWSEPQVEQEFGPLYLLETLGMRMVRSEKWIDNIVKFMEKWIRDQRNTANSG